MKGFKSARSSLANIQRPKVNSTPKNTMGTKFNKENNQTESVPLINLKSHKTTLLKGKIIKADKKKHQRQPSDSKENYKNYSINKTSDNLIARNDNTIETNKCIEQIEQELIQLKKLTHIKRPLAISNTNIQTNNISQNTMIETIIEIIKERSKDNPQFIIKLPYFMLVR